MHGGQQGSSASVRKEQSNIGKSLLINMSIVTRFAELQITGICPSIFSTPKSVDRIKESASTTKGSMPRLILA